MARQPGHVTICIAVTLASGAWGFYWLPQRALVDTGMTGGWATIAQFLISLAILAPIALWRWRKGKPIGFGQASIGFLIGGGFVLYANALLLTDVIRALVFFYLSPVWATVFEFVFLKIRPGRVRALSLALGFAGVWVVVGSDAGIPVPANAGDWLALASGVAIAAGAVRSQAVQPRGLFPLQWSFFFFGGLVALAQYPLLAGQLGPPPDIDAWLASLPLLIGLCLLFLIPSNTVLMWAPSRIGAGLFGILLLSELVVGSVSAALLANEPFGWREAVGCTLIVLAGLSEVLLQRRDGGDETV